MTNRRGISRNSDRFHFFGLQVSSLQMVTVMTNLDSVLKSRDVTLPTKVHVVKAMIFPVVMYRCESCTIKKAKHQRICAFELWCWRRLLRVPLTARRSKQSMLKEINPKLSLIGRTDVEAEAPVLWPPDAKRWLIGKDLDSGKIKGKGRREWHRMKWLYSITNSMNTNLGDSEEQGNLECCSTLARKESDMT